MGLGLDLAPAPPAPYLPQPTMLDFHPLGCVFMLCMVCPLFAVVTLLVPCSVRSVVLAVGVAEM